MFGCSCRLTAFICLNRIYISIGLHPCFLNPLPLYPSSISITIQKYYCYFRYCRYSITRIQCLLLCRKYRYYCYFRYRTIIYAIIFNIKNTVITVILLQIQIYIIADTYSCQLISIKYVTTTLYIIIEIQYNSNNGIYHIILLRQLKIAIRTLLNHCIYQNFLMNYCDL